MGVPETRSHERFRRMPRAGVLALAATVLVVIAIFSIYRSSQGDARSAQDSLAIYSGQGAQGSPPWLLPTDVPARVALAGLSLGPPGTAEHYHAHLDIIVDGKSIKVPAKIGINPHGGAVSAVHTHTPDGVIHIEADTVGQPFTLGQLFTEWDVKLSATQIGSFTNGGTKALSVFVNGSKVAGDPALIRLAKYQEIALVFGPIGDTVKVPKSYRFHFGR